ncbi:condensation domain-containing protein [Yinghuangia aomiensis]
MLLLVLLHHIAGDGWSTGPLSRDSGYTAYVRGARRAHAGAPAVRRDYAGNADCTVRRRPPWPSADRDDADSLLHRRLDYWRIDPSGLPDRLALPFDRPALDRRGIGRRPPAGPRRPGTPRATARAGAPLRRQHAHGAARLLAALFTSSRCRTDVPIGTPVAGRTDAALDELVGFFVNTLVLRTDTSGDPTFGEPLDRVRDRAGCPRAPGRPVRAGRRGRGTWRARSPITRCSRSCSPLSTVSPRCPDLPGLAVTEARQRGRTPPSTTSPSRLTRRRRRRPGRHGRIPHRPLHLVRCANPRRAGCACSARSRPSRRAADRPDRRARRGRTRGAARPGVRRPGRRRRAAGRLGGMCLPRR